MGDLGLCRDRRFDRAGATLIRRAGDELSTIAASAAADDPRLRSVQQRLSTLNIVNGLVLLSAVAAMVFKPSL
jgi:hypothetical protein